MSKSREEKEAEARDLQAQEQRAAAERERTVAREAERRVIEVGKPTTEERARLGRYQEKAVTPGETLMTQAGPISQAVARRVQERVETPGLEFQRDLPAYVQGVHDPLWRALKQRGIAPPPGTEGGGLGTQQYMKGAEPALALLRSEAVSRDITRGQEYGTEARGLTTRYEDLVNILSEALRTREVGGVTGGVPYGVAGEEAYGRGMVGARETEAEYAAERAGRQREKRQQEAEMIGEIIGSLVQMGIGAPAGVPAGIQGGVGGQKIQTAQFGETWSPYGGETPYSRALAQRARGY